MNERRKELADIFKDIEPNQRRLVDRLLDECVFLEERMEELKRLPFIRVHPTDPSKQKPTPAAKQYKETTQSYMNCVRILCSLLNKVEGVEDDPVQKFLERLNNV